MTIETKKIKGLTIKFSENDITIIDSYKIKNPDKMLIILKKGLQRNWEFLLYNRIPEYYINKWLTHNSLYRMNIFKKHNSKLKLDKKKHPIKKCFYWLFSRKDFIWRKIKKQPTLTSEAFMI